MSNIDPNTFFTNLLHYSRIHFPICSYAPMFSAEKAFNITMSVSEMTSSVFESRNMMTSCNGSLCKYVAVWWCTDAILSQEIRCLQSCQSKQKNKVLNSSLTGFKIGINHHPPAVVPGSNFGKLQRSLCMFRNTTAIVEAFKRVHHKSNLLYSKRCFVHWYRNEGKWIICIRWNFFHRVRL